jgi:hypothetical protein
VTEDAAGARGRPHLVVHIGWDAVSGGFLQRTLTRHFADLSRHKILFPATGRAPGQAGRHGMLRTMVAGTDPAQEWRPSRREFLDTLEAERTMTSAQSVVVSDQDLIVLGEVEVAKFGEFFSDYAITPLLVVCDFTQWVDQRYASAVVDRGSTGAPSARTIPGTLISRLAAWASIAADRKLLVVDAATADEETVLAAALDAAGAKDLQSDLEIAAEPPSVAPPPIVAIVRDFRVRGVSEPHLQALAEQLAMIPFTERLTNVPAELAATLDERYLAFHARLRAATFTRWIEPPRTRAPISLAEPILIPNETAAVFAIGRALAETAETT